MRRALVVVNPVAGRAAGAQFLPRLERGLASRGIAIRPVVTDKPGDARAVAAAQAPDHDVVVAVGGDGTVNEVLNGLEAARPLAVLPFGTGNVLAKELRLPRRVGRFCEMLAAGRLKALDVAAADGRRFLSIAGAGFDAAVAATVASRRTGGARQLHYVVPALKGLATYPFPPIEVRVDDGEAVRAEGFVLVSNVRAYGGPFVITPDAVPDDGLLDVCVLPRGSRWRCLRAMLACLARCPRRLGGLSYLRGRTVRVTSDERVPCQVDGDLAGFLPATIEMLDHQQALVVP